MAAALACPAVTARADDQTARLHFQAGANEFAAKRYEPALQSFNAAYELSQRPELLYNIALCHEELAQYGEAAAHLRRYLDEVENVPQRSALERRVEILEAAASREARAAEEQVEIAEEPQETPPEEASPPSKASKVPAPAWAAFGVSGASLVTGVVLASVGLSKKKDFESSCGATSSCERDDVKKMERLGVFADVSFGLAVAAAAAGTVLVFVLREDEEDRAVSLTPWAIRGSAGISISGRF